MYRPSRAHGSGVHLLHNTKTNSSLGGLGQGVFLFYHAQKWYNSLDHREGGGKWVETLYLTYMLGRLFPPTSLVHLGWWPVSPIIIDLLSQTDLLEQRN